MKPISLLTCLAFVALFSACAQTLQPPAHSRRLEGPGTPGYVATQPEAEAPGFSFVPGVSEAERSSTDFQNLTAYSALNDALTQNHGEILALAKVRGRLEAMIEIKSWDATVPHWEGK